MTQWCFKLILISESDIKGYLTQNKIGNQNKTGGNRQEIFCWTENGLSFEKAVGIICQTDYLVRRGTI